MSEKPTYAEVAGALPQWSVFDGVLHATFATGSFVAGTEFLRRICDLAEQANHHPDVDVRYGQVHVALVSHDVGALTSRDVDLATAVTALAAELGHQPTRPAGARRTDIAIDALDIPAAKAFWKVALGYEESGDDLVDPVGVAPLLWFQQLDAPRPERNTIHLDTWVDPDVVEQRIADAIAAGGTLRSDAEAPSFWVLADPEGNEVCLCTWQDRAN